MIKKDLRAQLKGKRASIDESLRHEKSKEIAERVAGSREFSEAESVMIYISFKDEAETEMIIKKAFALGKIVLVPVTEGENIYPCRLGELSGLQKGKFGIPEPQEKSKWQGKIDLCIVPGLGFDKSGRRLGFGGGYYDRFFEKTECRKMGIAFSEQIMPRIICEPWDISMDYVVTEKEMYVCG